MSSLISLFPTQVFRSQATNENYDLVQREVKECLNKILETDNFDDVSWIHEEAGKRRAARNAYFDIHEYLIDEDLIGNFNLVNLKKRIFDAAKQYVELTQWSRAFSNRKLSEGQERYVLHLKNSWMNIQSKFKSHEWHCHPGYHIAGTYYMRVSSEQGGIQFQNPNIMMQHCNFPENPRNSQSIEFVPSDGDIMLFPAWLMHNTMANTTDEDRISISFNIDIELPMDQK